jgi:hypothetical protein
VAAAKRQIARFARMPRTWRALVSRGQPFIVRCAPRRRLSLSRVRRLGASSEVTVRNLVDGESGVTNLARLVECIEQEDAIWYMAQQPVPPCLAEEIPENALGGFAGVRKPNLWIGAARAHTQLHQDHMNNVIQQLDGKKRFVLFAPSDARFLYRDPSPKNASRSQVKRTSTVDLARFPDVRKASPLCFELAPNDVLFLPAYWWHEVESLEPSLMVNYWWPPALSSLRGIDLEEASASVSMARAILMKHTDLSELASDHALVKALLRFRLTLLAAIVLGDIGDDFLRVVGARFGLDPVLEPETCGALLADRGRLSAQLVELLTIVRTEARTATACLQGKAPTPSLQSRAAIRLVDRAYRAEGIPPTRRMLQNNAVWLKELTTDAYLA